MSPALDFDPADHLPLSPIAFDILIALLGEDAHGYAIMQRVESRGGGVSVHAGTLYRALARLVDTELIEELDEAPRGSVDERRRYYRVTARGRLAATAEARRLESQLGAAREQGLLDPA